MYFSSSFILAALPLLATAAPGFQLPFAAKIGDALNTATTTRPGSGDVIDLTKYTIGQILNYTLSQHHREHHGDGDHDHDHEHEELAKALEDHGHPHHPPLVKLAWIVNRTEAIKEYLSDPDISITLFAPDDEALTPPRHEHHEAHDNAIEEADGVPRDHPFFTYADELTALTEGDNDNDDDGDDKDRERRREFIKKIVTAILKYHVSPEKLLFSELRDKQTIATALNQTKDVGVPFRIRASPRLEILPPPPRYDVALNFYAKVRRGPALLAKNGVIHLLSAPLLPPLTPLDQLLAFPIPFSALTSAVQQTELDGSLAPWLHHHKDDDKKSSLASRLGGNGEDEPSSIAMAVLEELVEEARNAAGLPKSDDFEAFPFTIFAPTNRAFAQIPFKIRTFLFSPFGKKYLKALLQFHVVPQQVFHSDYYLNATRGSKGSEITSSNTEEVSVPFIEMFNSEFEPTSLGDLPHFPRPPMPKRPNSGSGKCKAKVTRHVLPTLLGSAKNESLAVNVYEYRLGFGKGPLVRRLTVGHVGQDEHDYSKVFISDGVAWGGAVHVIGSLVMPPFAGHHGHRDEETSTFVHLNGRSHFAKEDHIADYFKSLMV